MRLASPLTRNAPSPIRLSPIRAAVPSVQVRTRSDRLGYVSAANMRWGECSRRDGDGTRTTLYCPLAEWAALIMLTQTGAAAEPVTLHLSVQQSRAGANRSDVARSRPDVARSNAMSHIPPPPQPERPGPNDPGSANGAPVRVTYTFDDRHRREVLLSALEAEALRNRGALARLPRQRWLMRGGLWKFLGSLVTILFAAFFGAIISDQYQDRQNELELEAEMIATISGDSVKVFQDAQNAARAPDEARDGKTNAAADAWTLESNKVLGLLKFYYPESRVLDQWDTYQQSMRKWAELANCNETTDCENDLAFIERYLDESGIEPVETRTDPDPWAVLTRVGAPDEETYGDLGLLLLQGRGKLLDELRHATPELD